MTGVVFEIQRWSVNDGPGIRTVVFLKGCPLNCIWCCNPEAWLQEPQVAIFPDKCRGCGHCVEVCPQGTAIPAAAGGFTEGAVCLGCGRCAEACVRDARELMGKYMTVDEVMKVAKRDSVFYRRSAGGVTFSGGEPLAQPDFVRALAAGCHSLGVHIIIETCGYFAWAENRDTIKRADLVFLDMKHMDPEVHKRVTGASNQRVLENAKHISEEKIPLAIRIPVVPSINDDVNNIRATAEFVSRNLDSTLGIELLPYHALGKGKYRALGLKYQLETVEAPSPGKMESLTKVVAEAGVSVVRF